MTVPYVPAHTNSAGTFHRSVALTMYRQSQSGFVDPSVSSAVISSSWKTPTNDGLYHPLFPGFRRATNYVRAVLKIEGGGDYDFTSISRLGGDQYRYYGQMDAPYQAWTSYPHRSAWVASDGRPSVGANLINRTVAEALLKVKDTNLNLGATLAEMKQTVSMVARAMTAILAAYRAVRRGDISYAIEILGGKTRTLDNSLKDPHTAWLAMQYGWRPLISDIYAGIELVNNGLRGKNALFSVTRTITQSIDKMAFIAGGVDTGYNNVSGEAFASCQVKLFGCVTSNVYYAQALGLTNPAAVAWELVPYSFVLDWLVPVGNWLQSLDATFGVSFVGGHRTDKVWSEVESTVHPVRNSIDWNFRGHLPRFKQRIVAMSRTAYTQWPWAFPYWVNPLSVSHTASAIALLAQTRR